MPPLMWTVGYMFGLNNTYLPTIGFYSFEAAITFAVRRAEHDRRKMTVRKRHFAGEEGWMF